MRLIADERERLDKFLARALPQHSRSKLAKIVEAGEVTVRGEQAKRSQIVEAGDEIELPEPAETEPHDLTPADIPLDVVFEDEHLLVVNKPRGLAAHPAASLKEPSLVNALLARNIELSQAAGAFRPGIVHRLDKDTTGLMIVAKTDAAHASLASQIEGKSAERRYFAVVAGDLGQERFTVNAPLARNKSNRLLMAVDPKGKPAVTHLLRVSRLEAGTLVAARLETGRTHQIRVHMQAIGHPVVGDDLYAPKEHRGLPLQLHAAFIAFTHPSSRERVECYADPPDDFVGASMTSKALILAL